MTSVVASAAQMEHFYIFAAYHLQHSVGYPIYSQWFFDVIP